MQITIPDHLKDDFLRFLDVAQSSFTDEDVANFHEGELEVLKLVEDLVEANLDGGAAKRYPTHAEKREASLELGLLASGQLNVYAALASCRNHKVADRI